MKAYLYTLIMPDESQEIMGYRWKIECEWYTIVGNHTYESFKSCRRGLHTFSKRLFGNRPIIVYEDDLYNPDIFV